MKNTLSLIKWFLIYPLKTLNYIKYKNNTMFGHQAFITNLLLAERVKNLKGDVIECGTWRGGMIDGFTEVLGDNRVYHLFDSFEGLPSVTIKDGNSAALYQKNTIENPTSGWDNCKAEVESAENIMRKSYATKYLIHKGWFSETLPKMDKTPIALLHLDGDWYDSIYVCLENLFDSVVSGGIIIVDDYTHWEGCTKAVHDFLSKRDLPLSIKQLNNKISYIIKN